MQDGSRALHVGVSRTRKTGNLSKKTARAGPERLTRWFVHNIGLPVEALYHKYIIEILLRPKPLPSSKGGRRIPLAVDRDDALVDERRGHAYISNSIRSSRYTVWDFLPKQILFQCTRLANFYFIVIGIPQAIPGFSTTGNYTTILPVLFFLLLTIVKEGLDDWRRHRLDKVENNALASVLRKRRGVSHTPVFERLVDAVRGAFDTFMRTLRRAETINAGVTIEDGETDYDDEYQWKKLKWHEIKVGDVLKLRRDDPVPADLALLSASGEEGVAYVETMALDGETNLKSKQGPTSLQRCQIITGIKSTCAEFVAEDPNRDLYAFNGRFVIEQKAAPLTLNEVILRGSTIRNTNSAIGLVLNTGEECKIRMNANHHPKAKKPRLERFNNQVILTLIAYVILVSVGLSIGYLLWQERIGRHSWYLEHAGVPFQYIIVGFLIMFNNVIPLSMYVSLEIVKLGQMLTISGDIGMFDETTNTRMTCNTNTILENLGQVSYVMTDKTGTLTENAMRFRGLSVAGTAWWHTEIQGKMQADLEAAKDTVTKTSMENTKTSRNGKDGIVVQEIELPDLTSQGRAMPGPSYRPPVERRSMDARRRGDERRTTSDMLLYVARHPNALFSRRAREFILGIALCHTALPETLEDGSLTFQASSPDELALIEAAKELGLLVTNRSSQSITLLEADQDGKEQRHVYGILDVIEFSSARKRMSIIVRCPGGQIWLLCKGADSAIVPRFRQAPLAVRKSSEVRQSLQIERDLRRKSENFTPRNSFGGRPSLTIRERSSFDVKVIPKQGTLQVPTFRHSENSLRPSLERVARGSGNLAFLDDAAMSDDAAVFERCFKHLDDFATAGLRTLLYAHKKLSPAEYASWRETYQAATTALVDRQDQIEAAGDVIEQGLELLGATAIEDKLQQGVPETIDKLRRANMKIWMLTGDKRETAINIAHAANLCRPESNVVILDTAKGNLESQLRDVDHEIFTDPSHTVVVIDGHTLADIETSSALQNSFYDDLVPNMNSVICCRASPAQKAGLVRAIRSRMSGLTLAIGDGANDVAMITTAHVGIGISGKEGLQAARVADFSIAQFRFLQRLLLVHGRWNYARTAKFILWTYWKEFFFYLVQALYQHTDGYTGSSLYENWSLTVLNTLFTSLCVIVPGMYEQDLSAETLLAIPELYVYGQRNEGLNLYKFFAWMLLATAQGMLIWFIPWALYGKFNAMGDNGTFALGDLCFSLSIMWTNVKLL